MFTLNAKGATTYNSSGNKCLDLFSNINAMRSNPDDKVIDLFRAAIAEDREDALKIMFWSRDVRFGQGERKAFRTLLKYLAKHEAKFLEDNIAFILEVGRWDDVYSLFGTALEECALKFIASEIENKNNLIGKWLPREQSKDSFIAYKIRKHLGLSAKDYRKLVVGLTNVVETRMCAREWTKINYKAVPSVAMNKYKKAFYKNDDVGFPQYLADVEAGKTTINAGVVYPHDIIKGYLRGEPHSQATELMWKNLPDYMKDSKFRCLPISDVSGSMSGQPMEVCIALSIYIAERNTGAFKDAFITFSSNPTLQVLKGSTLKERVKSLSSADWGMSTNLIKTFELVLNEAKKYNLSSDDLPNALIIFSDMQFNAACPSFKDAHIKKIKSMYEQAGYEMPRVIFWNLNAYTSTSAAKKNEEGVALLSGFSPTTFKTVFSGEIKSPYAVMKETIDVERYNKLKF